MKPFLTLGACVMLAACSAPKASDDPPPDASSSAAPASSVAASAPEVVPAELSAGFLGVWDVNPACPATSDTRLTVTATELSFFESGATIRKVTVNSATDAAIDADFSGEGESWTGSMQLRLSDDGKTLTTDEGTDKEVKRVRCTS